MPTWGPEIGCEAVHIPAARKRFQVPNIPTPDLPVLGPSYSSCAEEQHMSFSLQPAPNYVAQAWPQQGDA